MREVNCGHVYGTGIGLKKRVAKNTKKTINEKPLRRVASGGGTLPVQICDGPGKIERVEGQTG